MVYRQRANVRIRGPLGTGLDIEGQNPEPQQPKPSVNIEDATSRGGGIVADDQVGEGVNIRRVDVQDDILASSRKGDADPKV
jgi:hypothetical protein